MPGLKLTRDFLNYIYKSFFNKNLLLLLHQFNKTLFKMPYLPYYTKLTNHKINTLTIDHFFVNLL